MDTQKLIEALDAKINKGDLQPEEVIFVKLVKQIWQIDLTVAPYNVWTHMIEFDVPYFLRFMAVDEGDETEEEQLIKDWISNRKNLTNRTSDWQTRIIALIEELNRLRADAR